MAARRGPREVGDRLRPQALRRCADRHLQPGGKKVGQVSHLRNPEFVFVAGPRDKVAAAMAVGEGAVPVGA